MTLRTRLGLRLRVTDEEWPHVLALAGALGFMVFGAVLGWAAANAIVMTYGGADPLPRAYLTAALTLLALAPLFAWGAPRLSRRALVTVTFGGAALALASLPLGEYNTPDVASTWLAIAAVASTYPTLVFWSLASGIRGASAARRLQPLIVGGGSVGGVLAWFAAARIPIVLHTTADLAFAWALCLLAAMLLTLPQAGEGATTSYPLRELRSLARIPLTVPLVATTALAALVGWLINADFAVRLIDADGFPPLFFARDFARVSGMASAAALLVLAFLGRWLMQRLGVGGMMLLAPALLLGPTLVLAWAPTLGVSSACRFLELTLAGTIVASSVDKLCGALPQWGRLRMTALLHTLVAPFALAAASLLLLLLPGPGPLVPLLVMLWMLSLIGLRRRYVETLIASLQAPDEETRLGSLAALEHLTEHAVDRVLEQSLHSPQRDVVVFALELLREPGFAPLVPQVEPCLHSPHAEVREEALRTLAQRHPAEARTHVLGRLGDEAPSVRAAALEAAERLLEGSDEMRAALLDDGPRRLAEEPDPTVAAAWIHVLARAGWEVGQVREAVRQQRARGGPLALAAALGALPAEAGAEDAVLLLADPDPVVRRAAARGLRVPHAPATVHALLDLLLDDEVADSARDALASGGGAAVPALRERLAAESRITGRVRICDVLGRIGSPAAVEILVSALDDDAGRVRAAAARALRGWPTTLDDGSGPLTATARHIAVTLAQVKALEQLDSRRCGLLLDELRRQLEEARETVAILTPMSGSRPPPVDAEEAASPVEVLATLAASDDRWVSRCARWAMGEESEAMTVMEKVLFLRQVDLFKGLAGRDLAMIAENVSEETHGRDVTIFEEGATGDTLYLVSEGSVAVVTGDRIVGILGPRECFGEMALLSGDARSATIRTVEETRVLTMRRGDFRDLIERHPHIAFPIFEILSRRLRATTELLKRERG